MYLQGFWYGSGRHVRFTWNKDNIIISYGRNIGNKWAKLVSLAWPVKKDAAILEIFGPWYDRLYQQGGSGEGGASNNKKYARVKGNIRLRETKNFPC